LKVSGPGWFHSVQYTLQKHAGRPIQRVGEPADSGKFHSNPSTLWVGIGLSASGVVETTTTAEQ
jgi:hypothetical protein